MAITNHERVGKALEILKAGLGPFVEREIRNVHKDRAATEAKRYLGDACTCHRRWIHPPSFPTGLLSWNAQATE